MSRLERSYLATTLEFQPLWGLSLGELASAAQVADYSSSRVAEYRRTLAEIEKKLGRQPWPAEGSNAWLERKLLQSQLTLKQDEWGEQGAYRRNPGFYVGEWMYGLWYLFLRVPRRSLQVEAALQRLLDSEKIFQAAQENLADIPQLWLEIALDELAGYQQFLPEVRRQLESLAPTRRREIRQAIAKASHVAEAFARFLKARKKRSRGDFSVGKERFDFLLKHYHHESWDADALWDFGQEQLARITEDLQAQAAELGSKNWKLLLRQSKKSHPKASELLSVYQGEVRALKRFLKRRDLVTFPKGETLDITPTPVFTRGTIPFAAYVEPPMFAGKNRGVFFVTPVTARNEKQRRQLLEEHHLSSIRVTALHEAYPGHHLQFATQKSGSGILRKVFQSSSFYEGWALYCEEMMWEQGYYDGLTRLWQLRDKLWRACRIVIDVGLQTRGMGHAEAAKLLASRTGMSPAAASTDVNWYTMSPTVPQSYLTGMTRLFQIRERYQLLRGRRFQLKEFHDAVLGYGAVPLPLLERCLLKGKN